jgi:glycosyl transferase family 25
MWEFIDKVIYINLDNRIDRREHMEQMTSCFGDKIERFSAIKDEIRPIGCTRSHIAVLRMAIINNWKNILILEDDAVWNEFDKNYINLKNIASKNYDVIMLGATFTEHDLNYKLNKGLSSVGYLVNNHYFHTLLNNFEEGLSLYDRNISNDELHALDTWWNRLQRRDNWYIVVPCLVYQMPSYSDINYKYEDYRSLYGINTNPSIISITPVKSKLTFRNIFQK